MGKLGFLAVGLALTALCPAFGNLKPDAAEMTLKAKKETKTFHLLALCRRLEGTAEVMKPGSGEWEMLEEGHFYPLGSSFRSRGERSRLSVAFGVECEVAVTGDAAFGTLAQQLGEKRRTVVVDTGTLDLKLSKNFPTNAFFVTAPGFRIVNPRGEASLSYRKTGDGDEAVLRCVSGSLAVEGRNFALPEMYAANEVRIRTANDFLFTGLYGQSGDFVARLDQGEVFTHDEETGAVKVSHKTLDWTLSPKTGVRIVRAVPSLGERLAVTVMTFTAAGTLKNRCSFVEGCPEINTGEQGPLSRKEKEELAKKAADVTKAGEEAAEGADAENAAGEE